MYTQWNNACIIIHEFSNLFGDIFNLGLLVYAIMFSPSSLTLTPFYAFVYISHHFAGKPTVK